jgi:ABC-type long-subunit fatty acid transport system fused permease/ATPase subunit
MTTYHISAPFRNGLIGSIPNMGYKRIMLSTFIPIIITMEMVASNKKVSGNCNHHTTARIIAITLQRNIHTMKVGIKLLGASFLLRVIGIVIRIFLKKLEIIFH